MISSFMWPCVRLAAGTRPSKNLLILPVPLKERGIFVPSYKKTPSYSCKPEVAGAADGIMTPRLLPMVIFRLQRSLA